MNDITDKDLLRTIMFQHEWTQTDLSNALGFERSNISRIIHGKQSLTMERREHAKHLLKGTKKPPDDSPEGS